ncbi:hypothetical protein SAMN02745227_01978 [Anaerobranca californiensis DSM 14826]|uniref:DUF4369 domain-containing protein n=1 Tax=Anaerobranca californiensis DSM 14826 TaxID=1120989 RepID=A0A1M6R973_9FIRM|nr:hypothetical protein [Anaerobranca californiensis]SHK29015.1 hypothetical protein SAMN02745227_01978 [Anaerobranca californiensis DSM 14826]
MKIKKLLLFVFIFLLSFNVGGCSTSKGVSGEVIELSFADTISFDQIKKLDGKTVRIIGFMSTTSPLDGSYFYLQNMPYQSCPFCVPNTNVLANTIAVYAPKGQKFSFTDLPIKVTGRIKVEDVFDQLGYFYNYRIVDAQIERANPQSLNREIRIYTELVEKGFVDAFIDILEKVDRAVRHHLYSIDKGELERIELEKFEQLHQMFIGLNIDDYQDIIEVIDKLEDITKKVNRYIEEGNWGELNLLSKSLEEVFDGFLIWLTKPSF